MTADLNTDPALDYDAERSLLGGLLARPSAVATIGALTAESFADTRHGAVFAAIQAVADRAGAAADHMMVIQELRVRGDLIRVGAGEALGEWMLSCPMPGNVAWYAAQVRKAAQARALRVLGGQLQQVTHQADLDVVLDNAATLLVQLQVLVDHSGDDQAPVAGLSSLEDFVDEHDEGHDWVIPGLLERQDRVIVVASEGAGKTTLSRMVAVMLAAGVHPFAPTQRIPPMRTLIVDLENPPSLVRRKARHLVDRARDLGVWSDGRAYRWTKPGGLDIRRPADARLLDRVLADVRPALVCMGPLYKSYLAGTANAEQAAAEAAAVLDRLRERYGIALWLEAHAPLAQNGVRDLRPMNSGLWSRWPEFGLSLRTDAEDPHTLAVDSFRGHRDERSWPTHLRRGSSGDWPWQAVHASQAPTPSAAAAPPSDPYTRPASPPRRYAA